ncbi:MULTISPECIES: VOC family protein [Protofrankia]|uniref:Glyoxalase n=1 Tax=Protofrankia coriariae TaxID=1562887 RepID=A0ABR5F317_9ACTN|nr:MULTISPECIES: VOC family protein [Protofrankia]KLL11110.1 glyoxalase [Protofrankia coriariae]ONH34806.1 glyoxalase [Protofrankia sp. BMG5.30]
MRARLDQIVVDCCDPRSLVCFWAGLLGGEPVDRALGWSHVEPPGFVRLAFQPVPEEKGVKNRLHLDIEVDEIAPAVTEAERLGAVRVGKTVTTQLGSYQVTIDSEGNEFCLFCD